MQVNIVFSYYFEEILVYMKYFMYLCARFSDLTKTKWSAAANPWASGIATPLPECTSLLEHTYFSRERIVNQNRRA